MLMLLKIQMLLKKCVKKMLQAAAAGAPTRLAYSIRYESAGAKLYKGSEQTNEPISQTGAYYPQVPET